MLKIKEETTLVGVTELRREVPAVLKELKTGAITLVRRNRPVAMIIDYEKYQRFGRLMEALEDSVLGHLVQERVTRKGRKTISLEQAERRVGLKS